jgi:hypothetical protein
MKFALATYMRSNKGPERYNEEERSGARLPSFQVNSSCFWYSRKMCFFFKLSLSSPILESLDYGCGHWSDAFRVESCSDLEKPHSLAAASN